MLHTLTGLISGDAGAAFAAVLLVVAVAALLGFGSALAVVDLREHRLPDRFTGPLAAVLVPCVLVAGAAAGDLGASGRAAVCAVLGCAGFLAVHLVSPGTLGFGDVKLVPSLCALTGFLSWGHALLGFVAAVLVAGLQGLVTMIVRRDRRAHIAFGPALLLGALGALAW